MRLSIDKAVTQLGWRPRWSVGEAIRRTALWYRHFYEQSPAVAGSMRAHCLADIADFQAAGETRAGTPAPSPRPAGRGLG